MAAPPRTESVIPIIDIGALTCASSSAEERLKVAKQIGHTCETIGFFLIRNHGVDATTMEKAWNITRDFFDQPLEVKVGLSNRLLMTAQYPYGYSPYGGEILNKGKELDKEEVPAAKKQKTELKAGDMKEMFAVGPYNKLSTRPEPRYPSAPASMADVWQQYFKGMEDLASSLMHGFALALDLPESWFESKTDRHASALRALNYPTIGKPPEPGQMRVSMHTDYGVLTILKSGGPGLQVQDRDGQWHDVPFEPDCFVINLGDLMSRWTNDKWRSTPHQVVVPPLSAAGTGGSRRQSMAYFCNLNMNAPVAAIPTCVSAENPAKYPETKAGDHLLAKHLASTRGILDNSWMKEIQTS